MADSRGATGRIGDRDGRPIERRVSRLAVMLIVAAVILVGLTSPRALTTVHVGINAVSGLVWLGAAVMTRRWTERMLGMPMWMGFLTLSAAFLALAFFEARDGLG